MAQLRSLFLKKQQVLHSQEFLIKKRNARPHLINITKASKTNSPPGFYFHGRGAQRSKLGRHGDAGIEGPVCDTHISSTIHTPNVGGRKRARVPALGRPASRGLGRDAQLQNRVIAEVQICLGRIDKLTTKFRHLGEVTTGRGQTVRAP